MFDIRSDLLKKNLLTLDSKTTSIILLDTNLKYLFIHLIIQLWYFLDYTFLWKMFSLSLYLILCPPHPFIQGHWVTNGTSKPIPSCCLPCLCLSQPSVSQSIRRVSGMTRFSHFGWLFSQSFERELWASCEYLSFVFCPWLSTTLNDFSCYRLIFL